MKFSNNLECRVVSEDCARHNVAQRLLMDACRQRFVRWCHEARPCDSPEPEHLFRLGGLLLVDDFPATRNESSLQFGWLRRRAWTQAQPFFRCRQGISAQYVMSRSGGLLPGPRQLPVARMLPDPTDVRLERGYKLPERSLEPTLFTDEADVEEDVV